MPCVHTFGLKIKVYVHARQEHPPPHFHLVGPGWDAAVDIRTLEVKRGMVPRSELAAVRKWAAENRAYLLAKWEEYNERDDF
jgi:hypothetical protein